MASVELICTSVSPDRYVASFRVVDGSVEVFAYLPHVAGLNPFLLEEQDCIEGEVETKNGRLELLSASGQRERRRSNHG